MSRICRSHTLAQALLRRHFASKRLFGKTISAGLILLQSILSGWAKRVLILTPKSVQIQWQNELYEKFNLNVPIYDRAGLVWKPVHGARSATEKPVARDEW